jgi:hypothetical protein
MSESYRGNVNLKKSNVVINFTEEQVKEYVKCSQDPIYFAEHYIKIINVDHGLMSMTLYPYQKEIILACVRERYVVSSIPRQAGKTSALVAFALHQILFNDQYNILIAANKAKTAYEIMKRIQTAYEHLPNWLQQGLIKFNGSSVELENGSRCISTSTTADSARGFSFNCVILDEFAFIPKQMADEFFTSIFPTISSGKTSKLLIISTPKGLNHFHKIFTDAKRPKTDPNCNHYFPIEIKWSDVPGRDEEFKKDTIAKVGMDKWRQEYECEFLGSTNTLINASTLNNLVWCEPIIELEDIKIYEKPDPSRKYIIVCDPSEGKQLDYSAFVAIDITERPFQVVATWRRNDMEQMLVPNVLYYAAKMYNNAFILCETRNGTQIPDILYYEKEYENLLGAVPNGRAGLKLVNYSKTAKGIPTSPVSKSLGCSNIKLIMENDQLIINDEEIAEEMKNFCLRQNTYKADEGSHDDLMMCLVIFAWTTTQTYFENLSAVKIGEILVEKKKDLDEVFLPIFMFDNNKQQSDDDGWNDFFFA